MNLGIFEKISNFGVLACLVVTYAPNFNNFKDSNFTLLISAFSKYISLVLMLLRNKLKTDFYVIDQLPY